MLGSIWLLLPTQRAACTQYHHQDGEFSFSNFIDFFSVSIKHTHTHKKNVLQSLFFREIEKKNFGRFIVFHWCFFSSGLEIPSWRDRAASFNISAINRIESRTSKSFHWRKNVSLTLRALYQSPAIPQDSSVCCDQDCWCTWNSDLRVRWSPTYACRLQ